MALPEATGMSALAKLTRRLMFETVSERFGRVEEGAEHQMQTGMDWSISRLEGPGAGASNGSRPGMRGAAA